jgi:hypothetical protein
MRLKWELCDTFYKITSLWVFFYCTKIELIKQFNKKYLLKLFEWQSLVSRKKAIWHYQTCYLWAELDSNQRRRCRRIYSPLPLTTRSSTLYADANIQSGLLYYNIIDWFVNQGIFFLTYINCISICKKGSTSRVSQLIDFLFSMICIDLVIYLVMRYMHSYAT